MGMQAFLPFPVMVAIGVVWMTLIVPGVTSAPMVKTPPVGVAPVQSGQVAVRALLPSVMELDWLLSQFGWAHHPSDQVAESFSETEALVTARYQRYREAFVEEFTRQQPRVQQAYRDHTTPMYPRVDTGRELYKRWRHGLDRLAAIEVGFWHDLSSISALEETTLTLARLERTCRMYDLAFLNVVPETQTDLRQLLAEAEMKPSSHAAVLRVYEGYLTERLVALRHRVNELPRAIDDFDRTLQGYGVTDANRSEWPSGHIAAAINQSYVEGGQRLYRANARLAQITRKSIAQLKQVLAAPERSRLESTVNARLYPEVYEREDPVRMYVRSQNLETRADLADVLNAYDSQRREINQELVDRLTIYRDEWLALFGHPMIAAPVREYELDIRPIHAEREALEQRYLAIIASMVGTKDDQS